MAKRPSLAESLGPPGPRHWFDELDQDAQLELLAERDKYRAGKPTATLVDLWRTMRKLFGIADNRPPKITTFKDWMKHG